MDRWTYVKVTPSNQTLILGPAHGLQVTPSAPAAPAAVSAIPDFGAGDSVLKRVTIVTAHPDSTMVYMRADYEAADSNFAESDDSVVATVPVSAPATNTSRVVPPAAIAAANDPSAAGLAIGSRLLAPSARWNSAGMSTRGARALSLYASTQGHPSASGMAVHVDVLA
jgi:hypothetical protein